MNWLSAISLASRGPVPPPPVTGSYPGPEFPDAMLEQPVLVIEDEALIAWMVESLLEDLGFASITIVPDAEAAMEAAMRRAPRLIVSDINLGEGKRDGIEAVAQLRMISTAPIVFVTTHADPGNLARIEALCERAAVVRKPIARAPLVAGLRTAFGPGRLN